MGSELFTTLQEWKNKTKQKEIEEKIRKADVKSHEDNKRKKRENIHSFPDLSRTGMFQGSSLRGRIMEGPERGAHTSPQVALRCVPC